MNAIQQRWQKREKQAEVCNWIQAREFVRVVIPEPQLFAGNRHRVFCWQP